MIKLAQKNRNNFTETTCRFTSVTVDRIPHYFRERYAHVSDVPEE